MKNKFLVYVSLALLLTLAAVAAYFYLSPAASPQPVTLTDGLGRQVVLDAPAQKIISLAPSNTELLYAVGAGPQMIARDDFSDYPEEAKSLTGVGDAFGFNLEKIASLQPDLIMAAEVNSPEQVEALDELGLRVYYLANPEDLDGLYHNIETVGTLTGHQQESKALVETLKTRANAVIEAAGKVNEKPLVFYELDGTDPAKPWTSGPGTFLDLLLNLAGGQNAAAQLTSEWAQISQEELILSNPDIILMGDAAYGMTAEAIKARPGWASIQAVIDGRIYPFEDSLVSRPGPRMIDGLEALFKLLHPEAAGFLE